MVALPGRRRVSVTAGRSLLRLTSTRLARLYFFQAYYLMCFCVIKVIATFGETKKLQQTDGVAGYLLPDFVTLLD